jgi:hypothetical protein
VFERLRRARLQHVLWRARIPWHLWQAGTRDARALAHLDRRELHRLRRLASLFLHEKTVSGAQGLVVDEVMRVQIATQACLLILNLDLTYFRGWVEIILYPDTFLVDREEYDDTGVVHQAHRALAGESWHRGPVILSWSDARPGADPHGPDSNVILHEFAHKLDMLNGSANGMPALHRDMNRAQWTEAFTRAYDHLCHQVDRHHHTPIDPYATENPAEFFAVTTEVFFQEPARLHAAYPDVYRQLSLYFRQDPLARLS